MATESSSSFLDLESEQSILGAILLDNGVLDEASGLGLQAHDFCLNRHQIIFGAMLDLETAGLAIDLVTLTSRLNQVQQLQAIGGSVALTELFENSFRIGHIDAYIKLVQERARLRNVGMTAADIQRELSAGVEDVPQFLNSVEARMFESTQTGKSQGLVSVRTLLPAFLEGIDSRSSQNIDFVGLKTGLTEIDQITRGLKPHQIWVIAARPGMGKTSLVLSIMQHIGMKAGGVIALFSMEMKQEEILLRLLSGVTRIPADRLILGKLRDPEWQVLAKAMDVLSKARLYIDESGGISVLDIRSRCRRLKHKEKKLDLVIVDYIQLINPLSSRNTGTPESDLAAISRNLKELAKELDVPIIVLSQLNRASVSAGRNERPTLANLRGSGAIEQDADMVAFIHREEGANPNHDNNGITEIIFAKNRSGEQGTAQLAWIPHLTLFANLETQAGMTIN